MVRGSSTKLSKFKEFLRSRRIKASQNIKIKSIFNRLKKKNYRTSIWIRKARPDEKEESQDSENITSTRRGRIRLKMKAVTGNVKSSLQVTWRRTSTWCNNHRILTVVISSTTVLVISYFVIPGVRPVLVTVKTKFFKLVFKGSTGAGNPDIEHMKTVQIDQTSVQPPASVTKQKIVGYILTLAGIAGCLILVRVGISLKSSSIDFDDTCENVSFIFEDSLTGEAVNFATEVSGSLIPIASITNAFTTGVVYVFNGAASIAAYTGTMFLGRLEVANCSSPSLVELDCGRNFPTSLFVSLLTSSAPLRFIIHQEPIIKILNFLGFQFPQFGPYQLLDLFMYHPATNIFADILPEDSLWSWKTILSILTEQAPAEETGVLINNLVWDLTWDNYTPSDLLSLYPYLRSK